MRKYLCKNKLQLNVCCTISLVINTIVINYTNVQAQFRPIILDDFAPDWQLVHYDSSLIVGFSPEDGEMFFQEYATGEFLTIIKDTIYRLIT